MPEIQPPSQQPLAPDVQDARSVRRKGPDLLKIVLSLGIATSLVCIILQVAELSSDDCGSIFCLNELVTIILLVPSMYQFFRLLASYDGSLQDQKEKLAEKTKQLVDTMTNRMNDIKEQRENFANNATEFAGSNFEKAKKHFTKRLSRQNGSLYTDVKLVKEMRGFTSRWIRTYSQCALDPSQVLNGMEERLDRCSTIEELTECAAGFVDRISRIKLLSPTEEDPANSYMTIRAISNDVEQGAHSASSSQQPSRRRCIPSWIKFECHGHFGHDRGEKKCQDLKEKFDEEKKKWEVVERMQGLWKHRTNPFLDIMDNFHEMLEDVEDRMQKGELGSQEFDRLAFLQLVTKNLDDVDKKLGDVASWTQEGGDQKWKSQIGHRLKQMKSIVDPANFDQLNLKLVELRNDLLMDEQGVLALTNSASSASSGQSTPQRLI